jgi:hypothetical protein
MTSTLIPIIAFHATAGSPALERRNRSQVPAAIGQPSSLYTQLYLTQPAKG